jgi:hypothetical protein
MLRTKPLKPTVLYVGSDHCTAAIGPLLALVVKTDPDPSILEHQKRWIDYLRTNAPGGSAFITVLRSDTPPPTEEARARIRKVLANFGEVVTAGGMVIEGKGFVAATFRSVLSMVVLAIRPNYPFKIFADLREGIDWAVGHIQNPGVTVPELLAEFEHLKESYQAGTLVVSG